MVLVTDNTDPLSVDLIMVRAISVPLPSNDDDEALGEAIVAEYNRHDQCRDVFQCFARDAEPRS